LGADSFPTHIAGYFDRKIVSIYSNNFIDCVRPYWGDKNQHILLEPDRNGQKPSFAAQESPKSINKIKPETIAAGVLKLLGINNEYGFETVYMGNFYPNTVIESVPNHIVDLANLKLDSIVMRMDFLHNEECLAEQLSRGKCSIVTAKPIDENILKRFKGNIREIIYELDDSHNPEFVSIVSSLGINFSLYTQKTKDEEIAKFKSYYFDLGVVFRKPIINPENMSEFKDVDIKKLFYKSNKFTLSEGKIFPSKTAWLEKKAVNNFVTEPTPVSEDKTFWNEAEYLYILKEIDKNQKLNSI
jgi:hypothetical protein